MTPEPTASPRSAGAPPEQAAPSDTPRNGAGEVRPGSAGGPTSATAPRLNQAQPSSGSGWSLLSTPGLGPRLVVAGLIGLIISVGGLVTISLRRRRW